MRIRWHAIVLMGAVLLTGCAQPEPALIPTPTPAVTATPSPKPTPTATPRPTATATSTPTPAATLSSPPAVASSFASEPPNRGWSDQFGFAEHDEVWGVAVGADGTLYAVGWIEGTLPGQRNEGTRDAFLRKYDSSGREEWTRQFGSETQDGAEGVAVDLGGMVYVAGWTQGALGSQAQGREEDAFLRKYAASGDHLWTQQFGTDERDKALDVAVDGQGNAYVVGWTFGILPNQAGRGTGRGKMDSFIRKYDSSGIELWTRQFGPVPTDADITARSVVADREGNSYVAGWTQGTLTGQASSGHEAFIRKYDPTGKEIWTRQFGSVEPVEAFAVAVDTAGNVFVAGDIECGAPSRPDRCGVLPGQASAGSNDAFIRKYDGAGKELWTAQFGGIGWDSATSLAVDEEGNVYVAGVTNGLSRQGAGGSIDAFVRKYDTDGREQWTYETEIPQNDLARALVIDASDVIYVGGSVQGNPEGGNLGGSEDALVLQLIP